MASGAGCRSAGAVAVARAARCVGRPRCRTSSRSSCVVFLVADFLARPSWRGLAVGSPPRRRRSRVAAAVAFLAVAFLVAFFAVAFLAAAFLVALLSPAQARVSAVRQAGSGGWSTRRRLRRAGVGGSAVDRVDVVRRRACVLLSAPGRSGAARRRFGRRGRSAVFRRLASSAQACGGALASAAQDDRVLSKRRRRPPAYDTRVESDAAGQRSLCAVAVRVAICDRADHPRCRSLRRVGPARSGSAVAEPVRSRPATSRSPARMSSGRTAGVPCRTTTSSIAHSSASSTRAGAHRQARPRPPGSRTCGAPAWSSARPRRSVGPGTASTAASASASGHPGSSTAHAPASSRSARAPGAATTTSTMSRPSGSASSSWRRTTSGSHSCEHPDLEVLRLARRAGRRGVGVGDPRMRVETGRVRDREPRPAHGTLERPPEVAVAGEAQPAALGVADPQLLHGRRLLGGLFAHVLTIVRACSARPRRDRGGLELLDVAHATGSATRSGRARSPPLRSCATRKVSRMPIVSPEQAAEHARRSGDSRSSPSSTRRTPGSACRPG